jgi:hypothetical protein
MAEGSHLDRSHADIVVGCQHRIEFATHGTHKDGVRRDRARGTESLHCWGEHPLLLVAEEPLLSCMRVQCAHRQPRLRDPEPVAQPPARHLAGAHDLVGGQDQGDIAKREMRGDQHHSQLVARQHHRHVDVAGEMRQPLGMSGKRKPCEVQRVFLCGSGDDAIHFTGERQLRGAFHRAPGDSAGVNCATARDTLRLAPRTDWLVARGGDRCDLFAGADQGDVGIQLRGQRCGHDLRSNAARIPKGHREPDPGCHSSRISMCTLRRNSAK